MGQSEEVACAVFLRRPLGHLRLAERHQRRLRRMHGQTVAGKPHQQAAPLQPWLSLLLAPLIQDMMEDYIGHHGCNDPALHDPCLGMTSSPFFHDPGAPPLPNEAQYAPIIDSLTQSLAQTSPVDTVE